MANVRAVLQSCDPQLLDLSGDFEARDLTEASRMIVFLSDSRRVQKVLWRQLFVLDSMVSLVEELKSAQQLLIQPCPAAPDVGAQSRWKALKEKNRCGLEETENLLRTLLEKIHLIHERRERVTCLLHTLQKQSRHRQQLQEHVWKAQAELQQCELHLQQLQAQSERLQDFRANWDTLREELQVKMSLVQSVMNMKLRSLSPYELSLELSPSLGPGSECGPDLDPLRLTVKWGPDDTFTLQVSEDACGLVDSCSSGRWYSLKSVVLDVLQSYMGQAELLTEIQALRSSFAIDWRPAQRCLVFLKSASLVYELLVEEGYPRTGSIRLLSAHRDGTRLETAEIQSNSRKLSLSECLLLLSTKPGPNQD